LATPTTPDVVFLAPFVAASRLRSRSRSMRPLIAVNICAPRVPGRTMIVRTRLSTASVVPNCVPDLAHLQGTRADAVWLTDRAQQTSGAQALADSISVSTHG